MRVLKFGGSSVGTAQRLASVTSIVKAAAEAERLVVVISALEGVTDALEKMVESACTGSPSIKDAVETLKRRHLTILEETATGMGAEVTAGKIRALTRRISNLLAGVSLLGECPPSTRDRIVGMGESLSVTLLAASLRAAGVPARGWEGFDLLRTDSSYGRAEVDLEGSRRLIRSRFESTPLDEVPVIPGFVGADRSGRATVLGRGGSDYTAAVVGAALSVDCVEIWTDVNGILSADPVRVPDAFTVARISYAEAAELAHFGAVVLHPACIPPLAKRGIPIVVRNTLHPQGEETLITSEEEPGTVKAFAAVEGLSLLHLSNGSRPGLWSRVFRALDRMKIHPHLASHASSDRSLALVIPTHLTERLLRDLDCDSEATQPDVAGSEAAGSARLEIRAGRRDGIAVLVAVGSGIGGQANVGGEVLTVLGQAGIPVLALSDGASPRHLAIALDDGDLEQALRRLHSRVVLKRRRVSLVVAGATGSVGSALLRQLEAQRGRIARELGLDLRVNAALSSTRMAWSEDGLFEDGLIGNGLIGNGLIGNGLSPEAIPEALSAGEVADWDALLHRLRGGHLERPIFVDCTASARVAARYPVFIEMGFAIVTPNKLANSSGLDAYLRLLDLFRDRGVPYRYETTVGAALPILRTMEELRRGGDRILSVQAVLSGTLSFVFQQVNEGASFSEAVTAARERGFTEPHPREDLSGRDVARKLLILLREAGLQMEPDQIPVESLVPAGLEREEDPDAFLRLLTPHDVSWESRTDAARDAGERLVYLARFDGTDARVGVSSIAEDHPLASLNGTENMVVLKTERYGDVPLTIAGAGAGPEVTASGVLADIVAASRELVEAAPHTLPFSATPGPVLPRATQ